MWSKIQISLGVLALLLVFVGDRLSIPLLSYTGMACLGLVAMAIGWEAIITRHIVVGKRRSGNRGTYTGIPAIYQGILFNAFGLFLIIVTVMSYKKANMREVLLQFVRRPGLPLALIGTLVLMQAVITLAGSMEERHGSQRVVFLNLLFSRLLPGIILVILGLGAMGLGLFEMAAPNAFDAMGGGFLEMLYGLR
jgi:hypothetical protein